MPISTSLLPALRCFKIYFIRFTLTLSDDEACSEKYGADWIKYKAKVKYIFIPGVF